MVPSAWFPAQPGPLAGPDSRAAGAAQGAREVAAPAARRRHSEDGDGEFWQRLRGAVPVSEPKALGRPLGAAPARTPPAFRPLLCFHQLLRAPLPVFGF